MRVDKYLWSIRVFKTRTLATEACNSGKVTVQEQSVKPSRKIGTGDIIHVKKPPVTYTYKVLKPLEKRVGAKLVENYAENITPAEELQKLELMKNNKFGYRDKGSGRPTKKDRRVLDKYFGD